jgi:hypothetical protein
VIKRIQNWKPKPYAQLYSSPVSNVRFFLW